jgi:hypothetical protein
MSPIMRVGKMTPEQQDYIDKYKLVKLCGHGDNALYKSAWGARTIDSILNMAEYTNQYYAAQAEKAARPQRQSIQVSDELMRRHLHCVDTYGCGLFEGY